MSSDMARNPRQITDEAFQDANELDNDGLENQRSENHAPLVSSGQAEEEEEVLGADDKLYPANHLPPREEPLWRKVVDYVKAHPGKVILITAIVVASVFTAGSTAIVATGALGLVASVPTIALAVDAVGSGVIAAGVFVAPYLAPIANFVTTTLPQMAAPLIEAATPLLQTAGTAISNAWGAAVGVTSAFTGLTGALATAVTGLAAAAATISTGLIAVAATHRSAGNAPQAQAQAFMPPPHSPEAEKGKGRGQGQEVVVTVSPPSPSPSHAGRMAPSGNAVEMAANAAISQFGRGGNS
jgi:hypothetical protein